MQVKTEKAGGVTLERRLVELAWTDPDFAGLLKSDPRRALETIGVEVSPDVKIDIRQQRPDTLYFVIPPLAARQEDAGTVINQMDLWQSGELFCWIMPQTLKLELLRMRQSFRRNNP
ncbi:nitrile hydratase [Paraburkholderia hospita]|uniref:nitrile hydratase n=1 Tax=Paraburkholderia hospita TaxID=169430 RepID=UPI000B349609|nr:nitrile hydratase [Paraburkholderia hospita]OUL79613.1 nitrile hydratase [Paraburkholderia hospita]